MFSVELFHFGKSFFYRCADVTILTAVCERGTFFQEKVYKAVPFLSNKQKGKGLDLGAKPPR